MTFSNSAAPKRLQLMLLSDVGTVVVHNQLRAELRTAMFAWLRHLCGINLCCASEDVQYQDYNSKHYSFIQLTRHATIFQPTARHTFLERHRHRLLK